MDQHYQALVTYATLLRQNHWLDHARGAAATALALPVVGRGQAEALLEGIDRALADPGAFNLSASHRPIAIIPDAGAIISTLQLTQHADRRLQQEAFRQAVYYVSFETSSQCNRRCLYCPNSVNDRLSANTFLDDAAFAAVIADLRSIGYAKEVHFVGFNEPLMHADNLYGRLRLARSELPGAKIVVFTNGDYLDTEILDQLIAAGMDDMVISIHLAPGKPYNDADILARINRLAQGLQTPIAARSYQKDMAINVRLMHPRSRVAVYQFDYSRYGSNRAGILKHIGEQSAGRSAACLRPMHQFVVGHQGNIMPCCTMVSDDPSSQAHVVGRLTPQQDIFGIYNGSAFVGWRRSMFGTGPKASPCDTCTDFNWPTDLNDSTIYAAAEPGAPPADIRLINFSMTVDRLFFV